MCSVSPPSPPDSASKRGRGMVQCACGRGYQCSWVGTGFFTSQENLWSSIFFHSRTEWKQNNSEQNHFGLIKTYHSNFNLNFILHVLYIKLWGKKGILKWQMEMLSSKKVRVEHVDLIKMPFPLSPISLSKWNFYEFHTFLQKLCFQQICIFWWENILSENF